MGKPITLEWCIVVWSLTTRDCSSVLWFNAPQPQHAACVPSAFDIHIHNVAVTCCSYRIDKTRQLCRVASHFSTTCSMRLNVSMGKSITLQRHVVVWSLTTCDYSGVLWLISQQHVACKSTAFDVKVPNVATTRCNLKTDNTWRSRRTVIRCYTTRNVRSNVSMGKPITLQRHAVVWSLTTCDCGRVLWFSALP